MAGEAITENFMLGTATVMLGPVGDLFDLNPTDHSIGLVKNFRVTQEPQFQDLTQGRTNSLVYSAKTSNVVRAQMEAYEYTSRNMAYALGLDGAVFGPQSKETALSAASVANDDSVTVASATGFVVGDWVTIEGATDDAVYTRKIVTVVGSDITLHQALPKVLPVGSKMTKVNLLDIGSKEEQGFVAAKIVGHLANDKSIAMLFPKVRVVNGFSVGFTTENFDNLPIELAFYDSVATDPHYEMFKTRQGVLATST